MYSCAGAALSIREAFHLLWLYAWTFGNSALQASKHYFAGGLSWICLVATVIPGDFVHFQFCVMLLDLCLPTHSSGPFHVTFKLFLRHGYVTLGWPNECVF